MNRERMLIEAELLSKTSPELYDQGAFCSKTACGTAGCIAGWVAFNAGWRPYYGMDSFTTTAKVQRGGAIRDVSTIAAMALGLDDSEAEVLFTGSPGTGGWPEPWATQWSELDSLNNWPDYRRGVEVRNFLPPMFLAKAKRDLAVSFMRALGEGRVEL